MLRNISGEWLSGLACGLMLSHMVHVMHMPWTGALVLAYGIVIPLHEAGELIRYWNRWM